MSSSLNQGRARRYWTFCPLRTSGGQCRLWKRRMRKVRCRSGSYRRERSGKRRGGRRSAASRTRGRKNTSGSYPPRRSWQWQIQSRGRLGLLVSGFVSFVISLVRFHTIWDRPGRRAKGCLHCAASRGLRRGIGLYIWVHAPRHDLTRSHTSNE